MYIDKATKPSLITLIQAVEVTPKIEIKIASRVRLRKAATSATEILYFSFPSAKAAMRYLHQSHRQDQVFFEPPKCSDRNWRNATVLRFGSFQCQI